MLASFIVKRVLKSNKISTRRNHLPILNITVPILELLSLCSNWRSQLNSVNALCTVVGVATSLASLRLG